MITFLKLISSALLLMQIGVFSQTASPFFRDASNFDSRLMNEPLPACEFNGDPGNLQKACLYRERFYQEIHFRWKTAYGCLYYTQSNLIKPNVTTRFSECIYNRTSARADCFYMPGDKRCFPFEVRIPQTRQEIGRLLVSEAAVARWERCAKAAELCCKKDDAIHTVNETCPTAWDAWSCWQKGVVGESSTQVCPEFAYTNSGPACHHMSEKECFENGTWNLQTDYASCSVKPRLVNRILFHSCWLGVSAFLCLPAIIVLSAYKRLRERRFALHRNLLISILLRNIFVIIIKSAVMIEELTVADGDTVMVRNGFWCKLLTSLEKLAAGAAFTCMLVDGMFLHRRIVAVFKQDLNIKWVYSIAIGATIIPVIIWICLMASLNDSNCWLVYQVSNIQWVLDAPRLTMLFVNTILLVDILRVLFTKLRRQENDNQLSTAKATLFLMPLFGVQFLLTAWRPATTSCGLEQAYYFFTYAVDGMQGIMVSLLYCYLNKEVGLRLIVSRWLQTTFGSSFLSCTDRLDGNSASQRVRGLIQTTYRKTENVVSTRFRSQANKRCATQPDLDRRQTFSTMVVDKPDENEAQNDQDAINKAIAYNNTRYEATLEPESHVSNAQLFGSDSMICDNRFNDLSYLENDNPLDDEGFIPIGFEHDVENNNENIQTVNTSLTIPDFKHKKEDRDVVDYSFTHENIQTHNDNDGIIGSLVALVENIPIPKKRMTAFGGDEHVYENLNFKSSSKDIGKKIFPERFSQYSDIDDENIANSKNGDCNKSSVCQNKEFKNNDEEKSKNVVDDKICDGEYPTLQNGAILLPDDIIENVDALEIFRASLSDIAEANHKENINISKNGMLDNEKRQCENIVMDPNKLCPNRPDGKSLVFIDILDN